VGGLGGGGRWGGSWGIVRGRWGEGRGGRAAEEVWLAGRRGCTVRDIEEVARWCQRWSIFFLIFIAFSVIISIYDFLFFFLLTLFTSLLGVGLFVLFRGEGGGEGGGSRVERRGRRARGVG